MNALHIAMSRIFDDDVIKLTLIGSMILVGILGYTLISMIGAIFKTRSREQTKRDVAAYVAEGTMSPETAMMILGAEAKKPWEQQVAELLSDGMIDTKDAEKLLRAGPKSGEAPAVAAAVATAKAT